MKYLGKEDAYYTAAGIALIVSYLMFFWFLSLFGAFGWFLNLIGIIGLGAILGDFLHDWHNDRKFEQDINEIEEAFRNAHQNNPIQ